MSGNELTFSIRQSVREGQRLRAGDRIERRKLTTIRSETILVPDRQWLTHLQFRRFAGCPICKLHLRSIAQRHRELLDAGIREVAVFHSPVEEMIRHEAALPFSVVADPEKELYVEFGVETSLRSILDPRAWFAALRGLLLFGPGPPAADESALGLPADFLIGPTGEIWACKYGVHADDHWTVDELLGLASGRGRKDVP